MEPSIETLTSQLELADVLLTGSVRLLGPQDLPDRYGRVIQALDHVLDVCDCESVVSGGWAVWRHGFVGRVTQDIDVVLPSDRIEEFLRVASVSGFEVLVQAEGRWPKLRHRETGIDVDILPEGGRPGITALGKRMRAFASKSAAGRIDMVNLNLLRPRKRPILCHGLCSAAKSINMLTPSGGHARCGSRGLTWGCIVEPLRGE